MIKLRYASANNGFSVQGEIRRAVRGKERSAASRGPASGWLAWVRTAVAPCRDSPCQVNTCRDRVRKMRSTSNAPMARTALQSGLAN